MSLSLWYSLKGYVRIQIKGNPPIRLLELARENGIAVRGVRSGGDGALFACVTPDGFKKLRELNRRARCTVRITERVGAPFILAGLRGRPMLLWGGISALVMLQLLSGFVWKIEVAGCLNTEPEQIVSALYAEGITEGTPVSSIDHSGLGDRLILRTEGIAWIGVTIEGTRLLIEVVEETPAPATLDDATPTNIVASKEAIIASIFVYEGEAAVKKGDSVIPGQTLVSGTLTPAGTETSSRLVHARADITGRVWYTGRAYVSETTMEYVRTGRTQSASSIEIAGMEATEPSEFAAYDTEREVTCTCSWFFLPMTVVSENRSEIIKSEVIRTEEELQKLSGEASFSRASEKIPEDARIMDYKTTYQRTETGMIAVTVIETNETISAVSPIPAG